MCGVLAISSKYAFDNESIVYKILSTLEHRGKDNKNVVLLNNNCDAIGHCRLSLIDLSSSSNQPLSNEDSTLYLSFNGEIYNYKELRKQLISCGHVFKSTGDAEVVLHGFEEWGIDVLSHINGMFAFVLYDVNKKEYFCARDRIGIKPLYYTHSENFFIASSEIKAIINFPNFQKEINYYSLSEYFTYRYIPSPNTIYKNVYKLPPSTYIIYKNNKIYGPHEYWFLKLSQQKYNGDIVHEVKHRLLASVKNHLVSDVPIGIFLSGGIDSATIATLAKECSYNPTAFCLGFHNWENSEHIRAKKIAETLNIPFKEKVINNDSFHNITESVYYYDEPIADISIIPTFELCRFAAQYVPTVLSGDGGDELFTGYTWHMQAMKWLYLFKINPKRIVKFYAQSMSMGLFDNAELKKLLHHSLHSYIHHDVFHFYRKHFIKDVHPLKAIQYLDLKTFLSELVLTKVDRASMAHTLEVRVPFLDYKLVEFVFSLSPREYFQNKQTKYILRQIIKNTIPQEITKLPKQGFVGSDAFYQNKNIYIKYLTNSELVKNQIINKKMVEEYFLSNDFWRLWKILILELWFRKWILKI